MSKKQTKSALWIEAMLTNGGNATQAAVAAGYKKGPAAEKAGHRMSKNVLVSAELEKRRAEVLAAAQEKTQLTADEVLRSLARDVRFDPAKLYRPDGSILPIHEMDEDTRLALRGVEVDELTAGSGENRSVIGQTVKVKFPEKTSAREQGMKHFGLYKKDNEQQPIAVVVRSTRVAPFQPFKGRAAQAKA